MIGRRVGHFEVVERIGEGGMGVVYKARDTHLDRFVALKLLPPEAVAIEDRRRRFVQEAKAASALNHPNIITVYDAAEEDGQFYIAMEFVAGKTLGEAIGRKGLAAKEVLRLGIQIADALSAAHGAGITHRDLKPGNVMVGERGQVKVLDFGLAKLKPGVGQGSEEERTVTALDAPRTEDGVIVGTVAYMSPEQAEGRDVGPRSDIFAFGALLYEMLTGRRAFQRESRVSTLAAILKEEPPAVSAICAETPREVEKIIARCLRKDPERRYQTMADVKLALEEVKEELDSGTGAGAAVPPRKSRKVWWAAVVVVVLSIAGGAVWYWGQRGRGEESAAGLTRLTFDNGYVRDPALSPDGKLLAYSSDREGDGQLDIWVQQVGGGQPVRITNDPADDVEPNFSPDGTRIAFRSERQGGGVYVVSSLGGAATLIAPEGRRPRFSPNGEEIAYWIGNPAAGSLRAGLVQVHVISARGGPSRRIAAEMDSASFPEWTADGEQIVFAGRRSLDDPKTGADLWVTPKDGKNPAISTDAAGTLRQAGLQGILQLSTDYAAVGNNLFVLSAQAQSTRNLWMIELSSGSWKIQGKPERFTSGTQEEVHPSAAGSRLVFAGRTRTSNVWGVPLSANDGRVTDAPAQITHEGLYAWHPMFTGDGKKLLYHSSRGLILRDTGNGQESVVVAGGNVRLHKGVISPDGTRVAYSEFGKDSRLSAISVISSTGGLAAQVCDRECGQPHQLLNDNRSLLHAAGSPVAVWLLDTATKQKTKLYQHPEHSLWQASVSPDGRWCVFIETIDSDRKAIHVAPFRRAPVPPEQWRTIVAGDRENDKPRWSPDGKLLYFVSRRDGFRCIWALKLDAEMRPVGEPFAVLHLHAARRSMGGIGLFQLETTVAPGRLAYVLEETVGDVWMKGLR